MNVLFGSKCPSKYLLLLYVLQKIEIHSFSLYYLYKVQSKNPNGPKKYMNKNLIAESIKLKL